MDESQLFADLAEKLRVAYLRVAALDLAGEEKASISRHLGVIADASKHDLRRASQRLDTFLAQLDKEHPTLPGTQ